MLCRIQAMGLVTVSEAGQPVGQWWPLDCARTKFSFDKEKKESHRLRMSSPFCLFCLTMKQTI